MSSAMSSVSDLLLGGRQFWRERRVLGGQAQAPLPNTTSLSGVPVGTVRANTATIEGKRGIDKIDTQKVYIGLELECISAV